jgi:hypothetical protein
MLGRLRKAGQFLLDQDAKYAQAVNNRTNPGNEALAGMTRGTALKDVYAEPLIADSAVERVLGETMTAGVMAANVASRYALPAGGLTLAGAGLAELTSQFGQQADYPEQGQLPLQ